MKQRIDVGNVRLWFSQLSEVRRARCPLAVLGHFGQAVNGHLIAVKSFVAPGPTTTLCR